MSSGCAGTIGGHEARGESGTGVHGRDPAWKKAKPRAQGVGCREAEAEPLQRLLSPGPSPRGSPRGARAAQLQPPGDKGSRGDGRTPQSSPSPAHPGQRHLHREGAGRSSPGQSAPRCTHAPPSAPGASPCGERGLDAAMLPPAGPEAGRPEGARAWTQPEVAIMSRGRRLLEGPSALLGPWGLGRCP